MSRPRRATDSNVITVSLFNGDNSLLLFCLGLLAGYCLSRYLPRFA